MKNIINSLFKRFKRLAVLLILIPILTGAIAFIFESREPTTYIGTAEVMLGTFDNESITDQDLMKDQVGSRAFLERINNNHNLGMDVDYVSSKVKVELKPGKFLAYSLVGDNKEKVEKELSLAVEGFLKESKRVQQGLITVAEKGIAEAGKIESENEDITKVALVHQLQEDLINLQMGTELNKPVTVVENNNDPFKLGVLGLIVGLMISLAILVLPEIFKE